MHKLAKQAAERGQAMRRQAMAEAMQRKEEYLGARVPKELKDKVIASAHEQGIPVSLLIRKVLEEVFAGGSVAPAADNDNDQVKSGDAPFSAVLGWKLIELNQPQACHRCTTELSAGSEAVMGVTTDHGVIIICDTCKQELKHP